MEMSSANNGLPKQRAICIIITWQDGYIMHESDYASADYKLTPLPLLYLKCNLDLEERRWNAPTINLSNVWRTGSIPIEQNISVSS